MLRLSFFKERYDFLFQEQYTMEAHSLCSKEEGEKAAFGHAENEHLLSCSHMLQARILFQENRGKCTIILLLTLSIALN